MVYELYRFQHYLLGIHFFTICRWLLLFQDFSFEVVLNPRKKNASLDNISHIKFGEARGSLGD
jgi:hypothetical protein